jgi:hypothetical protein
MRPTLKLLSAWFASDPDAAYATQVSGLTPEQAAAQLLDRMDRAPNAKARDELFSAAMAHTGVFVDGVDAFVKGSTDLLEQLSNERTRERNIDRLSEESRYSSRPVPRERIAHFHQLAVQSSAQQRLSDRMRERDAEAAKHERPTVPALSAHRQAQVDDERDRYAALRAAVATASNDDGLVRLGREYGVRTGSGGEPDYGDRFAAHRGLRDTVAAAFEAHADIEAHRDPLQDERLQSMSDAV